MKLLISGCAGYIGSVITRMALERGHQVVGIDNLFFTDKGIKDLYDDPNFEFHQMDIRKFKEYTWEYPIMKTIFKDVDAVIHFAGFSNDPSANFDKDANMELNADATEWFAKACIDAGIKRFTFGGSCSVYDEGIDKEILMKDETTVVTNPLSNYAKAKFEAEKRLEELKQKHPDFEPVIFRQGTVYGWSPKMRWDLATNIWTKNLYNEFKSIKVFNEGKTWRPFVHVKDLSMAHLLAVEKKDYTADMLILNLADGNYQMLKLAHDIKHYYESIHDKKYYGEIDVEYEPRPDRSYKVDGSKVCRILGFTYDWDFEKATEEIVSELDRIGEDYDFNDEIYYTIKRLTNLQKYHDELKKIGKVFYE